MAIPTNNRLPFTFVEFDPSRASRGPAVLDFKAVIYGQKLTAGTKAANVPVLVSSADLAKQYFGAGSQLALMFAKWFENNKTTQVYGIPLDDDAGGVAATGTLAFAGPATADGVLYLYVGGQRLTVAVTSAQTATQVATAVAAAINAATNLPVTAAAATGNVTTTAKNKGPQGNDIDLRFNYNEGETFPTGITCTITGMASGAGAPVLTTAITAMGDTWFNILVGPYNDATSLTALETELASRFDAQRKIPGHYFTARKGNLSSQVTFGAGRNSPHVTVFDGESFPTQPCEIAAAAAAVAAYEYAIDPALPIHTLPLVGVLPPASTARRAYADNNALLFDGISPLAVDQASTVRLSTVISMYQVNGAGAADTAYLFLNTLMILQYLRYSFDNWLALRYARAKLAGDDTVVPAGDTVLTPKGGRSEAIAWFMAMMAEGYVENLDQFKRDLVVERNASDVNRMDFNLSPDLMNQYITGAVTFQFLN